MIKSQVIDKENIEETKDKILDLEEKLKSLKDKLVKRLDLTPSENGIRKGIRRNGFSYSVRNNRDRFFYPEEWMKFYDNLKESQKATFNFLMNTGARINEAINVKVEDIDLINKRLILRVTKVKARAGEKNPRPRIIPISSQFAKFLKAHIVKNELKSDNYLGLLSKPASHIALKKTLQSINIKDWQMFSTHNIRKTFETWLMALNIDGLKIITHLGHSMAVASGHYISPDVFSFQEKDKMRMILGDLYQK